MSINRMIFSGYCGKDMEVAFLPSGKAIGAFPMPVESGWGDNKRTSWVTCKVFGERAEKLQEHIQKGRKLIIVGTFQMDEWEKEGVKHSRPICLVDDIEFSAAGDSVGRTVSAIALSLQEAGRQVG